MNKFQTDMVKMVQAVCLDYAIHNNITDTIKGFSYDYNTETSADEENKYIFVYLKIEIKADFEKKKNKKSAGSFEFGFTFEVDNLNELISQKEGQQYLDDTLHLSVMGIAFSTARGIIITRGAGTVLNDAYLPIVNPATLLKTQVIKQ